MPHTPRLNRVLRKVAQEAALPPLSIRAPKSLSPEQFFNGSYSDRMANIQAALSDPNMRGKQVLSRILLSPPDLEPGSPNYAGYNEEEAGAGSFDSPSGRARALRYLAPLPGIPLKGTDDQGNPIEDGELIEKVRFKPFSGAGAPAEKSWGDYATPTNLAIAGGGALAAGGLGYLLYKALSAKKSKGRR